MSPTPSEKPLVPPAVRILAPELADQIAAGEVVERPASVVKELMENSLDAGATRIQVDIEEAGVGLIRVSDNGHGLRAVDVEIALTRHATSKISRLGDLFAITSFGFRGEALPSIASVSRFKLASKAADSQDAVEAGVSFGRFEGVSPSPLAQGTEVEVRELFGNVPARLKFLKSKPTEQRRIEDVFTRMALAHVDAGMKLTAGGRTLVHFTPGQDLRSRLRVLWPRELVDGLARVDGGGGGIEVRGLAGSPAQAQARGERMLFYVNSRPVTDKLLASACREAYKGRLLRGEYPQLVLFVDLPPEEVDVNAHPAKTEVRFRDQAAVFSKVLHAVREAVSRLDSPLADLGPGSRAQAPAPTRERLGAWAAPEHATDQDQDEAAPDEAAARPREPGFEKFAGRSAFLACVRDEQDREDLGPAPASSGFEDAGRDRPPTQADPACLRVAEAAGTWPAPAAIPAQALDAPVKALDQAQGTLGRASPGYEYLGQIGDTYLILKLPDGGLGLVDQHAAHERVLVEALARQAERGESRRLAVPYALPLHAAEARRLERMWTDLSDMGFQMSRPSPESLSLESIPADLDLAAAKDLVREILLGQTDGRQALLTRMACRRALKAGERLSPDEAESLLALWLACDEPEHCPHGRPALVRFSPADLEKLFKRRT